MNQATQKREAKMDLGDLLRAAQGARSMAERARREDEIRDAFNAPRAGMKPVVVLVRGDAEGTQGTQGTGDLDAQLELINRYLELRGLQNRATFGSRRGASPEEHFEELLAFLDKNTYVTQIVVADFASLGQDANLAVENSRRIASRGCEVASVR